MAAKQTIEVVLEKHPTMEATGITIPFDVEKVFGAKRVPVKATVNGAVYTGSIVRMGGKYMLGIPKAFRDEAGISAGDTIKVTIEADTAPQNRRRAKGPCLGHQESRRLGRMGDTELHPSQRTCPRCRGSQKAETRLKRIEKAIEMLMQKPARY